MPIKSIFILLVLLFNLIVPSLLHAANNTEGFAMPISTQPLQLVTVKSSPAQRAVLREPAQIVPFPLDKNTRTFIKSFRTFFKTLESPYGKPAGLAAPQVGVPLKIIIMQIPPEAKKIRKDVFNTLPLTIWINPSYVPVNQAETKDWEGCYSVPNKMGEVYRYQAIQYEAYTLTGKKITGIAKGFFARLIQHEVGHLNSELYIDLPCKDCRRGSMEKMMKLRKQEMEAN